MTQVLNKIKKIPEHSFVDTVKVENVEKILDSLLVRARQSFQFFRQKTWFLGNNRALSNFFVRYRLQDYILPYVLR